jgi:quercetin dioxygenase-like cupin family protein
VSTSLLRTDRLQLLHLVLPQHEDLPQHWVDDTCMLHCLEGQVEVMLPSGLRRLNAGELVVLPPAQAHALRARSDAALLMTLLHHGPADATGGPGAPPA